LILRFIVLTVPLILYDYISTLERLR